MSFASLFASPEFKSASRNVIAALLFDIGKQDFKKIDRQLVESIFFKSITDASRNILKSEKTKRKILDNLQAQNLKEALEEFRKNGQSLDEDYFEDRFSKVISPKNARKIVPTFLENFRSKIANDKNLLEQIAANYLENMRNGAWQPGTAQIQEAPAATAEVPAPAKKSKKAIKKPAPASYVRQEFEMMYVNSPQSGQITHWDHDKYVLPVRGLRALESALSENSFLHISGVAGCGKSLLISAYLHNLVFNKFLEGKDVYYYRFVEGISNYDSFILSLTAFLENQKIGGVSEEIARDLPLYTLRSSSIFVLDDVHHVKNPALLELISQIWNSVENSSTFRGQLIVVDRESSNDFLQSQKSRYCYKGLSIAETNALLRDKWRLEMPRLLARQLAKKLSGNPQLMLLFKNWWNIETHTDTELERFLVQMPAADPLGKDLRALREYAVMHLFRSFERVDSRLNSFLKAASIFRLPEREPFLEEVYNHIGGGDFQSCLEKLVENHELLVFDDNLNCYILHDLLQELYYPAIHSVQLRRILHYSAGKLYRNRFQQSQKIADAIEGAYHFRIAEREEEAIRLLEPVMVMENLGDYKVTQLLNILESINADIFDSEPARINALYGRGKLYLQVGLLKQAEQDLTQCEKLQPPDHLKASIAYSLGLIARNRGNAEQAFALFRQALQMYEQVEDKKGAAEVYTRLSDLYLAREQNDLAYDTLTKSLHLYQELDDLRGALHAYSNLAKISKVKNDLDEAAGYYAKSLEIYEKIRDQGGIAEMLKKLGEIHELRGDLEKALELFSRAINIDEKLNYWVGAAAAYEKTGNIYRRKEDLQQAMRFYKEAQIIFENSEDLDGLASVYNNIAAIHYAREEWDAAMGFYQKSQEIYEKTDHLSEYGRSFSQMGMIYKALQDWERALDMYDKALEIKEKIEDTPGIAEIYKNIGDIYYARREYRYALEVYERSLAMYETLGDDAGIAQVFFQMGNVQKDDKQWQKAIQHYQKSIQFFRKLNNRQGLAGVNLALGGVFREIKDWSRALEFYRKAIEICEESKELKGLANAYYNVGAIYHDTAELTLALENYRKSIPVYQKAGDWSGLAQTLGNISSIEFERKEHIPAITKQVEILLYFQERGRRELVERVLANLMACHQELGPNTFQALLSSCLEKISREGVNWGEHPIIAAEKAKKMISKIFYSS